MQFPGDQAKVIVLGKEMADGFSANRDTYPTPPVEPDELEHSIAECEAARGAIVAAQAALKQAVSAKDRKLDTLIDQMKRDLRYAENTVDYDDDRLKLIGWGGRRAASPLAVPGQVRSLHAPAQGDGWITLTWKKPLDGGKVANYRIERREAGLDAWTLVETVIGTETTLRQQEPGKTFEYCVLAMNKAGLGEESNTVTAVL